MGNLRALPILFVVLLACGCTLQPLATPTATPSPSASPSATPMATPTPSGTSTVSAAPTPDLGVVPQFHAGDLATTAIDGLRVRQRPGEKGLIVTGLLPLGAELQVVMGPIPVDELGWYLVTDADADEPQFGEGWVAAGFEPDPFLAATGARDPASPFIASFAQTGNAEYGPVEIGDGEHVVRWVATDPERTRCDFAVGLAVDANSPVPAIRATVGSGVDPGTLQAPAFDALGVRGQAFIAVTSDCAWTLVIQAVPPAEPSPSA